MLPVPVAVAGDAIMYRLGGLDTVTTWPEGPDGSSEAPNLAMSWSTIAHVLMGDVGQWDDDRIASDNPWAEGLLPSTQLTVVLPPFPSSTMAAIVGRLMQQVPAFETWVQSRLRGDSAADATSLKLTSDIYPTAGDLAAL